MFLVGTVLRFGFVTAWLFHLVACMGGCLGCATKLKPITSVNEPVKGENRPVSEPCRVEGVWTSSTCGMDNSAANSLESVSSISTSFPTLDSQGTGNTSHDFINHGFHLWNQTRQQWIGNKRKSENQGQHLREPRLSWNATYDSLLSSNKPFAKPILLSEMVDFLVDIWEQDGTYG